MNITRSTDRAVMCLEGVTGRSDSATAGNVYSMGGYKQKWWLLSPPLDLTIRILRECGRGQGDVH